MHISTSSGCNKARNFALGLLASIGSVVNYIIYDKTLLLTIEKNIL